MSGQRPRKRPNFVSLNEKAKSEVVAQFVRIARKARLSYDDFLYVAQQTRRKLGLRRTKKECTLPQLPLPEAELRRFFQVIQDFIDHGKGAKDRYILFPSSFRLVLKSHLRAYRLALRSVEV